MRQEHAVTTCDGDFAEMLYSSNLQEAAVASYIGVSGGVMERRRSAAACGSVSIEMSEKDDGGVGVGEGGIRWRRKTSAKPKR